MGVDKRCKSLPLLVLCLLIGGHHVALVLQPLDTGQILRGYGQVRLSFKRGRVVEQRDHFLMR